jgi:hypothetical protein
VNGDNSVLNATDYDPKLLRLTGDNLTFLAVGLAWLLSHV